MLLIVARVTAIYSLLSLELGLHRLSSLGSRLSVILSQKRCIPPYKKRAAIAPDALVAGGGSLSPDSISTMCIGVKPRARLPVEFLQVGMR